MLLASLLLGLAVTALYASALYTAAWKLGRSKGARWLPLAWLIGGLLYAALTFAKLLWQGATLHIPPQTDLDTLAIESTLAYGLCGAALLTLSVRKRLRLHVQSRPTMPDIRAGIGAFYCGMLLTLIVPTAHDLIALYRQLAR
jgi:uncharacterized membrane protein YbhN (UPF0104 family)